MVKLIDLPALDKLAQWEERLSPYLKHVEILAEIPLEQEDLQDILIQTKYLCNTSCIILALAGVETNTINEFVITTRLFQEKFPSVFVVFLSHFAAHTESRNFWATLAEQLWGDKRTGRFYQSETHWGKLFLEIVKAHPNLKNYEAVERGKTRQYVMPIRLHGGIPAHSLPDFFEYILLPSVEKAPYDGMDDQEALITLLEKKTTRQLVDDVVQYFFDHTGEFGLRFFSKCRHMARLAKTNQPLPPAKELGLRPYVVQSFESFQERQVTPAVRRRRPRLLFDPYTPAFRIFLPAQPLSLEQAGTRYDARLIDMEAGTVLAEQTHLRPRRQGSDWFLEEVEWQLEEPLSRVEIVLSPHGVESPLNSYSLRILPPEESPPLLAFRYQNRQQARLSPSLPAGEMWLFYPADCELRIEGTEKLLEELHPFAPPWQDWQAHAWDLSQVRSARLLRAGQDICAPIAVSRPLEPGLSTPNLPPHLRVLDETPLYDAAPQVILPLRSPADPAKELRDWRLRLEAHSTAALQGIWEASADELPYLIENNEARLALTPWLGESPVGKYSLTVSRLGRSVAELPFRVCAGLRVEGLEPYYLPTEQGAQPVTFTLHLPSNAHLQAEDESEVISSADGRFTICVPAEASQTDLRLEVPATPQPIRIPLRVALPRMRWTLALKRETAIEWTSVPISLPLAQLMQADLASYHPRLRVELPLTAEATLEVKLHLTAPECKAPLQTRPADSSGKSSFAFDLAAFFDTLRAESNKSVFEFHLELRDVSRNLNLSLPVLRLTRELDIHICHFQACAGNTWRLHWYEPDPLRYRRLRLWSLWQPWADPIEIPLPDEACQSDSVPDNGWWMHEVPETFGLPPSAYRGQFVIVSPYDKSHIPSFPPEQAIDIKMNEPKERLQQIQSELKTATPARSFALHFERMCIYHHSLRDEQSKQAEIQWCLSHWQSASLIHLEAIVRWLRQYDSKENYHAFLIHLFRETTLKRLREERHPAEFVRRLLSSIVDLNTISPESARYVLALANEPAVILQALWLLFQSSSKESCQAFWESLEQGQFSEADAVALLKNHAEFARHLLREAPVSSLRSRLLRELSRYLDLPEYVVKTGYYILCDVGWGKLIEIFDSEPMDYFFCEQQKPVLVVEPLHWQGQRVQIDLKNQRIALSEKRNAYRCACNRFIALRGKENERMWQEHLSFCGSSSAAITPIPPTYTLSNPPRYQAVQPTNPLDTRFGG
ncbi:MAG: hypothetical protein ANABAC_3505 [Anaerolineae bacterium]|nr:MAG: hypothetical protein ANABAC_3505 [Anaerolineae bacterium]